MRFIVRAQIPTEAGNKMVKNPKFLQELENYIQKVKAEAAYFFEAGGDRTFAFIINIESADMIPSIAEPLFQDVGAKVEFHPVMVFEDLKKAIEHLNQNCVISINTKDICNTIFYDKKKDIITTETVYTTYSDLEPNQKSPFEIMLLADEGKKI